MAGLTHKSALIAWGAFYFKTRTDGRAKLVDDHDLQWIHPPRCDTIGCTSKPYGPARVEVRDDSGALVASALTNTHNHAAISGLQPNTRYTYSVTVKHELWGAGVRWDWDPLRQGLLQQDRVYRHEFRTLPDPQTRLTEPFSFVVIGDFGVGMRKPSSSKKRQFEIAQALERAVDEYDARLILTTGDNIYASRRFLLWTGDSGDEDDDWFFTYFQPYRYVLNRIPVWPSIGNHDTQETEEHDDRAQVMDNMYLRDRLAGEEAASIPRRRTSSGAGGCSSIRSTWSSWSRRSRRRKPIASSGGSRSATIRRTVRARSITTRGGWPRSSSCSNAAASARTSAATSTTSRTRAWTASTTSSRAPAQRSAAASRTASPRRTRTRGPASATSCSSRLMPNACSCA